jgi:hypothetical protein
MYHDWDTESFALCQHLVHPSLLIVVAHLHLEYCGIGVIARGCHHDLHTVAGG